MKRILLIAIIIIQGAILYAQNNEIIVNDSSQYGFNRPRLALLNNDVPFVLWGKSGSAAKVYGAKLVGNNFSTPVQIVPDSMNPRVGTVDGPNIVAYKDSIYVVWENLNASNSHIFLNRSTDGGNSFGSWIQTDSLPLADLKEYPGISVNNNGELGIYFIRLDPANNNPRQTLIISKDRGITFGKDSTVNTFAAGQPCECCQGSMEMQDSNWVFYYRNNVNNIRNNYALVSSNSGDSFDNSYELDDLDWFIQSCPSSGPEGHLNGNKSFTAWMSRGSGSYRILYASVNMSTGTVSPAAFIDPSVASNVYQNYPSVDGSGDTIAVVWQDNRYLFSHIFTSISIDGGTSFSSAILLSDTSVISSYVTGDVAFANGVFHYVWKSSNKIFYRSATLSNLLSISTNNLKNSAFKIYPNPTSNQLTIETTLAIDEILILDITGKTIKSFTPSKTIDISDLSNGIYFIKIIGEENSITQKFVKQ